MTLRKRAEKLAYRIEQSEGEENWTEVIEQFAREVRDAALEEAAQLAQKLRDEEWFDVAPEIRALKEKSQ